ncbi:MAG: 3'-5' exonuclease [Chromatiaceae bacterium]|nr:3'-5' exonuclease [Chromatiaceae bacterium]
MSIWKFLFNLDERRNWYLRKMPEGPLRSYYESSFPANDTDWRQVDYLALDFETTGLDKRKDEILSIGFAPIRGQSIRLSEADHFLARPVSAIPEASAVIHGILDDTASVARPLEEVLPRLLKALESKVLLAHHAAIEYEFLSCACKKIYGYPFIGPVVDTLALEVRIFRSMDKPIRSGDLRLDKARQRYNLPRYPAHNALIDAIAAGELFLAQGTYRRKRRPLQLKDMTVIT